MFSERQRVQLLWSWYIHTQLVITFMEHLNQCLKVIVHFLDAKSHTNSWKNYCNSTKYWQSYRKPTSIYEHSGHRGSSVKILSEDDAGV